MNYSELKSKVLKNLMLLLRNMIKNYQKLFFFIFFFCFFYIIIKPYAIKKVIEEFCKKKTGEMESWRYFSL